MSIRVVVADDQAAVREALAVVLDLAEGLSVVGTAADGATAAEVAIAQNADVVLMDLRMPGVDGVEGTRRLTADAPSIAVVVLTTFADDDSVLAALAAGARGFLTKDAGREDIARAVRAAAAGQSVLDSGVQQRLVAAARPGAASPAVAPTELAELTAREREVLALIGRGLRNREIARHLVVSEATVKTHVNNLFAKAGLRDRAQAIRLAHRAGLVPDD